MVARTDRLEVLDQFREQPDQFGLVITDTTMPKMTGDKFAMELIKIRSDIPIILCSGYSARLSEERANALGIRAFAKNLPGKTDE